MTARIGSGTVNRDVKKEPRWLKRKHDKRAADAAADAVSDAAETAIVELWNLSAALLAGCASPDLCVHSLLVYPSL